MINTATTVLDFGDIKGELREEIPTIEREIGYAPTTASLANLRLKTLNDRSRRLESQGSTSNSSISSYLETLQNQIKDCAKQYKLKNIEQQKRMKNSEFETIFDGEQTMK